MAPNNAEQWANRRHHRRASTWPRPRSVHSCFLHRPRSGPQSLFLHSLGLSLPTTPPHTPSPASANVRKCRKTAKERKTLTYIYHCSSNHMNMNITTINPILYITQNVMDFFKDMTFNAMHKICKNVKKKGIKPNRIFCSYFPQILLD